MKIAVFKIEKDSLNPEALITMRNKTAELYANYKYQKIENRLNKIEKAIQTTASTRTAYSAFKDLKTAFEHGLDYLYTTENTHKLYQASALVI